MTDSKPLRLLHISDLHFGRIEDRVLKKLENYITSQENVFHLAILTGDLTQRAKSAQFIAAKEFLAKLKCPLFLVPGNHDVPLYNPFLRFFSPYSKFKRHFGKQSYNFYEDEHLAVYGLWTVNNFKIKEGTVDSAQILDMEEKFLKTSREKIRLLAFHHPLTTVESSHVEQALHRIRAAQPHILMWGHDHRATATYWDEQNEKGPVMVAAGTTVSNRTREEANSFNIIEINQTQIKVHLVSYNLDREDFEQIKTLDFEIAKVQAPV